MKKITSFSLLILLISSIRINAQCTATVPARSPNTGIAPGGLGFAIRNAQSFTPACSGNVASMTFTFDNSSDDLRGTGYFIKCNLKNSSGTIIARGIWPNGKDTTDNVIPRGTITADFSCSNVTLVSGTQYTWELESVPPAGQPGFPIFLFSKSTSNVYTGGDLIEDGVTTANKDFLGWVVTMGNANIAAANSSITQNVSCNTFKNATPELIANVLPNGASPIAGNTTAKVWIEATQPASYVKRHYEITPASNAATATGRLTLYFTQAEFNAFNALNTVKLPTGPADASGKANLLIEKRAGTSNNGTGLPNTYTGTTLTINPVDADIVWNSGVSRWEISFDVTGFSGFFVKSLTGILPLQWLSVHANLNSSKRAVISFSVQESDVSGYSIERSNDGRGFTAIASISSKGNGENNYQYTDAVAIEGTRYYRIRQTDRNGLYNYSSIITLSDHNSIPLTVFPNPVKDIVTIQGASLGTTIILADLSGKVLQEVMVSKQSFTIDMGRYNSGVYLLKTQQGEAVKIVKQ